MQNKKVIERIDNALKKAGWKFSRYQRKYSERSMHYYVSFPAVTHEQRFPTATLDVKDSLSCDFSMMLHEEKFRVPGSERPVAFEILEQVNEECKPHHYELYTTGYFGIDGKIPWREDVGDWKAVFWSELDKAMDGLDRIASLLMMHREHSLRQHGNDEETADPNRFVTEKDLCSFVEIDGCVADMPEKDVIYLSDYEDFDEYCIERKLTVDRDDCRLYWETRCPKWKLDASDFDRAIRYANDWNAGHLGTGTVLHVDEVDARFVWTRIIDYRWVTSEDRQSDFSDSLFELIGVDKDDVEKSLSDFGIRIRGDEVELPLFDQKGTMEESDDDIPF